MKALSRTVRATLPAILLAFAACDVDLSGITLDQTCCLGGGGAPFVVPLALTPPVNILRGDYAQISAWTTQGDPKSTWELTGPAVFVLGPDTVDTRIVTPVGSVTVRGTGAGEVKVKAVRANTVDSATASFFVADSADVTLRIAGSKDLNLRVGNEFVIAAQLLDRSGRWYGAAFVWTSSDTNIVTLAYDTSPTPFSRIVRGRAAGAAKVVVAVGAQRDTARVQVAP